MFVCDRYRTYPRRVLNFTDALFYRQNTLPVAQTRLFGVKMLFPAGGLDFLQQNHRFRRRGLVSCNKIIISGGTDSLSCNKIIVPG